MSDQTGIQAGQPSARQTNAMHEDAPEFAREVWNTRLGFVLAAVGSAVGLGNMWRFPYITSEYGGAAFVVLYILMTFVIGIPVLLAEFTIGRRARQSSVGALRAAGGRPWVPLGYLFVLTGMLILAFYSVIAGWVTRYALVALFTGFPEDTGAYFSSIASGIPAMGFHLFTMAVTIAIVMGGVEKGIERASFVMMPILFLVVVGLAVWAATLQGSGEGYAFYLTPRLEELFSARTIAAAAGQAFFSLSLGMGAMLTFASYLSKKENLPREATVIAFTDFGVAFTAGLVVFPVIFALGLQGALFFIALFIGAITSAISLLEVVVAALIDEWKFSRKPAAVGAGTIIALIGLWPAADTNALGFLDAVTNNIFLPLGSLFLAVLVGWLLKNPLEEVTRNTSERIRPLLIGWLWILRVVAPILLVFVLYTSLPIVADAFRALTGR